MTILSILRKFLDPNAYYHLMHRSNNRNTRLRLKGKVNPAGTKLARKAAEGMLTKRI